MTTHRSIGIGLGRIGQWHDGIGEFVRRYAQTLAARAPMLREREGWQFTYHLPRRWHGLFGDDVRYLDVQDRHRWLHRQAVRLDLEQRDIGALVGADDPGLEFPLVGQADGHLVSPVDDMGVGQNVTVAVDDEA